MSQAIIDRMRARGLTVHDVRAQLPRRIPNYMDRPLSAIQIIAQHWDAEPRPKGYDTMEKIKRQAWYHYNKDWGGGYGGDGLQYHLQVDNAGDVYWCRDFTDVTWHVGDANYKSLGICCHGLYQDPTREMAEALQIIYDVLTTQTPEIPAARNNVMGHKEIPGNSTACPGNFLPAVLQYRANGKIQVTNYIYDFGPIGGKPLEDDMIVIIRPIQTFRFKLKQGIQFWDIPGQRVLGDTGLDFDIVAKTNIIDVAGRSSTFYIFSDRFASGEPVGVREEELFNTNNHRLPVEVIEPQAPVAKPDPVIVGKADKFDKIAPLFKQISTLIGG